MEIKDYYSELLAIYVKISIVSFLITWSTYLNL